MIMSFPRPFLWSCCLWLAMAAIVHAQGIVDPALPDGAAAATKQMAAFRLPPGMQAKLFAAEPQLSSPVAIGLDEQGRVFVAEEYRFNRGTEENRTRGFLLEDDLQVKTLEDRLKMFQKHADKFPGGIDWFTKYTDQVRLLEDTDRDGRADRSVVFATGFNGILDGMIAGVAARDGDVYVTSIPHLWRLRDRDGDGVADDREKLLTGFGVNASFLGHDLHGLAWGPDGKLYFSIGDRGFDVASKEGAVHSLPQRGAVFRCLPDGREFEVVHVGLRNPQELAFDDHGNLFADDNNSDKGDDARLVYIVEGGDSGWSMPYQTMPEPYLTGPWHAEKMWHAACDEQPAWVLPRVGKIGNGPTGFAYYPGVGLDERYRGHFFMANYVGGGGIESFAVKPSGASFEMVDYHDFLKPLQATDIEFGFDGKLYVSDFVGLDWGGATKGGRIYSLAHETHTKSPVVDQTRELFGRGFSKLTIDELVTLLQHADQRVRQRAQFALAARGENAFTGLKATLAQKEHQFARLHALWAIGQMAREIPAMVEAIVLTLADEDHELRAHAARLVGDIGYQQGTAKLIALLEDEQPRVAFFAAQSLGKLKSAQAVEPLFALLRRNADRDRYLRHAAVYALHRIGAVDVAAQHRTDPDVAARRAALLVLRLGKDDRIADFLDDVDPQLVLEAARSINDLPLEQHTQRLAALSSRLHEHRNLVIDPLVRRVLHAHFRLGARENVQAVVKVAADPLFADTMRGEAVRMLNDWLSPGSRDRVTGSWRPFGARDAQAITSGIAPDSLVAILAASSSDVQRLAVEMAMKHRLGGGDDLLLAWVRDPSKGSAARAAALRLLSKRGHAEAAKLLEDGRRDADAAYRAAVLEVLADVRPDDAEQHACECLELESSLVERQTALALLSRRKTPPADAMLMKWLRRLQTGDVALELHLDLIEAACARKEAALTAALRKYESALASDDTLARWRPALAGGNAAAGERLFVNHAQAQCIRCHQVRGKGGGTAGPELSRVAATNNREHLLESLLRPNAKIAPGFGAVTLSLDDGRVVAGVLKSEQDSVVELLTPQGALLKIPASSIEDRSAPQSAMPTMETSLTPRELRDLIEFLSTLK